MSVLISSSKFTGGRITVFEVSPAATTLDAEHCVVQDMM